MYRVILLLSLLFTPLSFSYDGKLTNLPHLKETLDNLKFEHQILYTFNGKAANDLRYNLYMRILSWIFYLDSSVEGPLYSAPFFDYLKQVPICKDRLLLEILNEELDLIPPHLRNIILSEFFIKNDAKHSISEYKLSLFKYFIFAGTESGVLKDSDPWEHHSTISDTMIENLEFIRSVFYRQIELNEAKNLIASANPLPVYSFTSNHTCQDDFDLNSLFPWWDLSDLKYYFSNNNSTIDLTQDLVNIFMTSKMPLALSISNSKPLASSPHSIAYAPNIKLNPLAGMSPSPQFMQAYFKAVPQIAYQNDNQLTAESCNVLAGALSWGALLGFKVTSDNYTYYGITEATFNQWMLLKGTLFATLFNNNDFSKVCHFAFNFMSLIWINSTPFPSPHSILKFNSTYHRRKFRVSANFGPEWTSKVKIDRKVYINDTGDDYIQKATHFWPYKFWIGW